MAKWNNEINGNKSVPACELPVERQPEPGTPAGAAILTVAIAITCPDVRCIDVQMSLSLKIDVRCPVRSVRLDKQMMTDDQMIDDDDDAR